MIHHPGLKKLIFFEKVSRAITLPLTLLYSKLYVWENPFSMDRIAQKC
jgi:hypothetical protein